MPAPPPPFGNGPGCTPDNNLYSGTQMADFLKVARQSGALAEALLFRAWLYGFCPGGMNALFTGDGYTFTGTGGTLAPLGRELIFSPFEITWKPSDAASIPICISALNGGKPVDGKCPLPLSK